MNKFDALYIEPFCPYCNEDVDRNLPERNEEFSVRMGLCTHCDTPFEWRKFFLEDKKIIWPRRIDERFCSLSGVPVRHRSPFDWTEFGGSSLRNFSPFDPKGIVFGRSNIDGTDQWSFSKDRLDANDTYDWSVLLDLNLDKVFVNNRQATVSSICMYRGDLFLGINDGQVARIRDAYRMEQEPTKEQKENITRYKYSATEEYMHKHIAIVDDIICSAGTATSNSTDTIVCFWHVDEAYRVQKYRISPGQGEFELVRHPSTIGVNNFAFTLFLASRNNKVLYVFPTKTCLDESFEPLQIDISESVIEPIHYGEKTFFLSEEGVHYIMYRPDFVSVGKIPVSTTFNGEKSILANAVILSQTAGETTNDGKKVIYSILDAGGVYYSVTITIARQEIGAHVLIREVILRGHQGDLRGATLSVWNQPNGISDDQINNKILVTTELGIRSFTSFMEPFEEFENTPDGVITPPIMGSYGALYYLSSLRIHSKNWFLGNMSRYNPNSYITDGPGKEKTKMVICGRTVFLVDEVQGSIGKKIKIWKQTLTKFNLNGNNP